MRVLTVVPLPPGPRGGIEDYAYGVLRGLSGLAEIDILAPAEGPDGRPNSEWNQSPLHLVPARWMFRRLLPWGKRSRSRVEACVKQAEVVHLHMPCPRLERWTAISAARCGVPLVATYHMDAIYDGGNIHARSGALGRLLERMYDSLSARPALSMAKVIVTNSLQYARESRLLPSFLPKVRAIHQGVNLDHTQSRDDVALVRRDLTGGGGALVTFLGRLVPYKGVHFLIESAGLLRHEPIAFAIAGKGSLIETLKKDVDRRSLRAHVRFLGFVPDEAVADLLRASDVVVCPSISLAESTPIVLLEALACGTPIVGTRLGGNAETLPDDGIRGRLVPPRDAAALATAIRELLQRNPWAPNRPPFGSRTWTEVAAEYFRLYEEVLSS